MEQYDIVSKDQLLNSLPLKNDFQLLREFSLWSSLDDLLGFLYISIIPAIYVLTYLFRSKEHFSPTVLIVVYSIAISIGLLKTIFDMVIFYRILRKGFTAL